MPRVHCVQTSGCAPLKRAYDRVVKLVGDAVSGFEGLGSAQVASKLAENPEAVEEALKYVRAHAEEFMWAWEETPHSIAHGVLDDETYDWYTIVTGMISTQGFPITVEDDSVITAYELGHAIGMDVCHTGACGLGGLVHFSGGAQNQTDEDVSSLVYFTGQVRGPQAKM
eukprot:TRINITY_DN53027_c0_g1_i1.p1 TRINITY_DN53027_c0_g1~~TRINITY_DN53027_c0_g1_i1.p1  ORF type:complete len:169 (-),score=37.03 TRINITY_DN53027_c0_g1_i1:165-671(-)